MWPTVKTKTQLQKNKTRKTKTTTTTTKRSDICHIPHLQPSTSSTQWLRQTKADGGLKVLDRSHNLLLQWFTVEVQQWVMLGHEDWGSELSLKPSLLETHFHIFLSIQKAALKELFYSARCQESTPVITDKYCSFFDSSLTHLRFEHQAKWDMGHAGDNVDVEAASFMDLLSTAWSPQRIFFPKLDFGSCNSSNLHDITLHVLYNHSCSQDGLAQY